MPVDSWRLEAYRYGDYGWNARLLWEGRPAPGDWIQVPLAGQGEDFVRATALRDGETLFREERVAHAYPFGSNTWLHFDGARLAVDRDRAPEGAPYDLRRWFSDGIYRYGPFLVGPVRIGDRLSCLDEAGMQGS